MTHYTNTGNPIDFPKIDKQMNERIRLLAEQAGIVFWEMSGDVDWRQANRETLEEFAESIVKECCTVLAKCKEEPFPFDEDYACRLLKTHFGVE